MNADSKDQSAWRRKHDEPAGPPYIPAGQLHAHLYPSSRDQLKAALREALAEPASPEVRPCGSHWSLGEAVASSTFSGVMIESRAMNATLYDVIPDCLSPEALTWLTAQTDTPDGTLNLDLYNLYHVEAGIPIFELYSRLDRQDLPRWPVPTDTIAVHPALRKSRRWAMPTLGGAGGQTIVGAVSTSTHGGDLHQVPIADAITAIHLFASDGREYWIEPRSFLPDGSPLTVDEPLRGVYPGIIIIRDNALFQSVLVSAGRFGVIYSIVLKVVAQYGLIEKRHRYDWNVIDARLRDPGDDLYKTRFLQVVVNPHPRRSDGVHSCWITQRDAVPDSTSDYQVSRERRAGANAGKNPPASRSPHDFQSRVCSAPDAIGIIAPLAEIVLGPLAFLHRLPFAGPLLARIIAPLQWDLHRALKRVEDDSPVTLGDVVAKVCNVLVRFKRLDWSPKSTSWSSGSGKRLKPERDLT